MPSELFIELIREVYNFLINRYLDIVRIYKLLKREYY